MPRPGSFLPEWPFLLSGESGGLGSPHLIYLAGAPTREPTAAPTWEPCLPGPSQPPIKAIT